MGKNCYRLVPLLLAPAGHCPILKGLETDAMVLVDVPEIDGNFRKEHLYVACSRARHLLTVLMR